MIDPSQLKLPQKTPGPRRECERRGLPTSFTSCEPEYSDDENEFILAVSHFRSVNKIGTPTVCQLLWVLKQLGYRKCACDRADQISGEKDAAVTKASSSAGRKAVAEEASAKKGAGRARRHPADE